MPSWSIRRCLGEVKEFLDDQGGALSWGEALSRPPLLALKATITALVGVLPDKPAFEQLEGSNPTVGQVLDMFEQQLTGKKKVQPIGNAQPAWARGLMLPGCLGVVYVWPAFYGADP